MKDSHTEWDQAIEASLLHTTSCKVREFTTIWSSGINMNSKLQLNYQTFYKSENKDSYNYGLNTHIQEFASLWWLKVFQFPLFKEQKTLKQMNWGWLKALTFHFVLDEPRLWTWKSLGEQLSWSPTFCFGAILREGYLRWLSQPWMVLPRILTLPQADEN